MIWAALILAVGALLCAIGCALDCRAYARRAERAAARAVEAALNAEDSVRRAQLARDQVRREQ